MTFFMNNLEVTEKMHIFAAEKYNIMSLSPKTAVLSNRKGMTSFRFEDCNIRFRTPAVLKKYKEIKEWNNGYLVVMADYEGLGVTEEYIDLLPILKNLNIDSDSFLKNIQTVKIGSYES